MWLVYWVHLVVKKGADVLEKLATMALSERARFSFKLIGYSYRQLSAVETTGPYKVENLMALIEQHEVDLIFVPRPVAGNL